MAQWRYEASNGEARAYVVNPDRTQFGFRCTTRPEDRQNILIDLYVVPLTTAPDEEEVARFTIGTWTFTMETLPIGALRNGLQRYQSRMDFLHPVQVNMRNQVSRGSVVRFEQTFDFARVNFSLRGSARAMERLEAACPVLWNGGRAPGSRLPVQAAPSGNIGWNVERDAQYVRAVVRRRDAVLFGIQCERGRADQTRWIFQLSNTVLGQTNPPLALVIDGQRFAPFENVTPGMFTRDAVLGYYAEFSPELQAGVLQALRGGATHVSVPLTSSTQQAVFGLNGFPEAFDTVMAECGYDPDSLPGGAGMPARAASPDQEPASVPDEAVQALRNYILSVVQPQCTPGASVDLPDDAFRVSGDRVSVLLGRADCDWQFRINPFCGAARCQVWIYEWLGDRFELIAEQLR
ncbi:hypothetical protein roselon_02042 [Roseibacterium elongatum DSM 19469]|uniref:Uncharacterized protein n=1 Tax=Roseicyclus elongatus DSM 19469 TaxID=1294273 RepID=W8RTA6_9RHOB|nr:hypothetical protein roselon_02042 [Roseibacterium elongatum DSM 19469]